MIRNLIGLIILLCAINLGCMTTYDSQTNSTAQQMAELKKGITENAKSFEGGHKSVLLKAWGVPKSKSDDGLGGEIYLYSHSVTQSYGTLAVYINMYLNKDGKVYSSDVKQLLI